MKEAFGLSIPETLQDVCVASRCALIIYDMQKGIVPQISEGHEILVRCEHLLAAARIAGFRIFFTRHVFLPPAVAGVGQLRRAMIWQHQADPAKTISLMPQGSPGWEIVPELAPLPGEVLIDKITMSAFESTFLNVALRDAGIDAFIIAGIALEVGIEPTVRHGLDLNYVPVMVTDACGSQTAEAKKRSLATLAATEEVIRCSLDELLKTLRR